MQDEITETIVGEIEPELGKAERQRARSKKPENMDAWDVHQRGLFHLYRFTKEDTAEARRLFERAIKEDASLGAAYSGLAETHYFDAVYGFAASPEDCRALALSPARRGVELDNEDAAAHCTLGRIYYMRREHEAAVPELESAIELNPSFALAHYGLGAALVFSGRAADSFRHLEMAVRLSPHDPNMGSFMVRLADAHLLMRQHDEAVDWAKKAFRQTGTQWSRHAALISALSHLGRLDEARSALEGLLELRPDFTQTFVRKTHLFSDSGDLEHYLDGLRKTGVAD